MSEASEIGAAVPAEDDDLESHILAVHLGHAANCSSLGSVVDFLFVSAVAGAALLAAVVAALGKEQAEVEKVAAKETPEGDDAG